MKNQHKSTLSVHAGTATDLLHKGAVTPIHTSTAFEYLDVDRHAYPRYFNTPNLRVVGEKIAALENGEAGMVFSSGMAAITTAMFAFLKQGDHAVFQNDLYGGTHHAVSKELERYGIEYTFVDSMDAKDYEKAIKDNTKFLFIETPSNPLMRIIDLKAIADMAKAKGVLTLIDNTFASPINQNPIDFGIDVVLHSATKYLGGHSDISSGAIVTSHKLMEQIHGSAIHFGGNLDAQACALLERSIKTLEVRVTRQNENALAIAEFLQKHPKVENVYYPGLPSHPDYELAKSQMTGFGGMLSFEIDGNPDQLVKNLKLIAPVMSLGGVESTITCPAQTSHAKLTAEQRKAVGIKDNLLRLSTGIEHVEDLIGDLKQSLEA